MNIEYPSLFQTYPGLIGGLTSIEPNAAEPNPNPNPSPTPGVYICTVLWTQVEDMLKRSFAEFHAQRSHPEALQKLAEGKARLEALRARPWPNSPHATSQQEVEEYFHVSEHIQALTNHIQVSRPPFPCSAPPLAPPPNPLSPYKLHSR